MISRNVASNGLRVTIRSSEPYGARTSSNLMSTDFSAQFDDAFADFFREAAEANTRVRRVADPVGNPAWEALPERTRALLERAGITHNGDVLYAPEGPAAQQLKPLDAPIRLTPVAGRHKDKFATERNIARQKFVLSMIAAAAANNGWVDLEDVAALHLGCGVGNYSSGSNNDYVSSAAVAAELHRRLRRTVAVEGDRIVIPNLKQHPKLAHLNKVANLIIGKVKSEAKSGFKAAA